MKDGNWIAAWYAAAVVIIVIAVVYAPHAPDQSSNPRFVLHDLTERNCVYDNVSRKYISCWLKKDGP